MKIFFKSAIHPKILTLCIDCNQVITCGLGKLRGCTKICWAAHQRFHQHLMKHAMRAHPTKSGERTGSKLYDYIRDNCELCQSKAFKKTKASFIDGQVYIDRPCTEEDIISTWTTGPYNGRRKKTTSKKSLRKKPTGPTPEKRLNDALSIAIIIDDINDTQARINEIENMSVASPKGLCYHQLCNKLQSKMKNLSKAENKLKSEIESIVSDEGSLVNENTIWYEKNNGKKIEKNEHKIKERDEKRKASVRQL